MPIGGIRTPETPNQWPWMLSLRSLKTCLNSNFFANREAHAPHDRNGPAVHVEHGCQPLDAEQVPH